MTRAELNDLLELVKACVVNEQSTHIEDACRYTALKDDFETKWCSDTDLQRELDEADMPGGFHG